MGCFWGPEAYFGSLAGVMRTRTGYAGGTTPMPAYRNLGDHTETIEVVFDPEHLSLDQVMRLFWRKHHPNRPPYKGRQYISLLRYKNQEHKGVIEAVKAEFEQELGVRIETDIAPLSQFTPAEERHQKYDLKRFPRVLEQLQDLFPKIEMLHDSTFAARLNGLAKGASNRSELVEEISGWGISEEYRNLLINRLKQLKW